MPDKKNDENEFLVDKDGENVEGEAFDNLENVTLDNIDEFEVWDEDDSGETAETDIGGLEEFETKSIEEDFAEFEDQVSAEQSTMASKDMKKAKSGGGLLKSLFTLVVLGGLIGGGAYGYMTFKDDINKLINGFDPNAAYVAPSNTENLPQDSLATLSDMPGTMPQPTPITADVPQYDDLQDFVEPAPIYDGAPEPVEQAVAEPADPFAEMVAPADEAVVETEVVETEISAEPMSEPVAEVIEETMTATAPVLSPDMPDDTAMSPMIPMEQLANNTPDTDPALESVMEDMSAPSMPAMEDVAETPMDTAPVSAEVEMPVVDDTAMAPPVEEVTAVIETDDGMVEEATIVEETPVVEAPKVVEKVKEEPKEEVKEVAVVKAKPVSTPKQPALKTDKNIYENAERNTTVYNLIQTQDLKLARQAASSKRYDDALAIYDRLARQNPTNYDVLIGRATTLEYMGRREEAVAAYNNVLKISPSDTRAKAMRDQLMAGAPMAVKPAVTAAPRAAAVVAPVVQSGAISAQQAIALANANQYQQAMSVIGQVRAKDPSNALHAYTAAIIYDRAGDRSMATRLYEEALELDSTQGSVNGLPRGQIYDRLSVIR
jgi:Flp pilus assembly protein TadD